jgi:hypothetical protein
LNCNYFRRESFPYEIDRSSLKEWHVFRPFKDPPPRAFQLRGRVPVFDTRLMGQAFEEEGDTETRKAFNERAAKQEIARRCIEAFVRHQSGTKHLQPFADLAKLYADAGGAEPYDKRLQRAHCELKHSLLTGRFHRGGAPCVWAIHENEKQRCNVMGEELPGFAITNEILQQFRGDPNLGHLDHLAWWIPFLWAPTDLCRRWLEAHGVLPPDDWLPADSESPVDNCAERHGAPQTYTYRRLFLGQGAKERKEETRGAKPKYDWEEYERIFCNWMDERGDFAASGQVSEWNSQANAEAAVLELIERDKGEGNGPAPSTIRRYVRGWAAGWRKGQN